MELTLDKQKVFVGSIVDEVLSVIEVDTNDIQNTPSIGNKYHAEFINGMIKEDDKFIMILNMEMVFTLDELTVLKKENTIEV